MRATGMGAGFAALGGAGYAASQEDGDDDGDDEQEDDTVWNDLTDPVFGYPLSAGETESVQLERVVEMIAAEGEGAHEGFPPDAPAEFFFDPVGLQVEPGTVVQFVSTSGLHTATSYHEKYSEPPAFSLPTRIPDGVPGFSSPPVTPGESWLYEFSTTGVYDVLCLPHLGFGMVMRVVVFDSREDDIQDEQFAEPTGGFVSPMDEAVLTAAELDPANIVEQGSVAWEDLTIEVPQQPTGTPTETPPGTPTGTPTETPTETPTGTSTGTPTEAPTGTPTGTPTETPTEEE